jgi:hypothetical protein
VRRRWAARPGEPGAGSLPAECHSRSIIGATYIVTGNEGKVLSDVTMDLTSFTGVTSDELSPIIAFELNLVGPFNSERTVLSSGAGTIVYYASAPLIVSSQEPPCAESNYYTAETANGAKSGGRASVRDHYGPGTWVTVAG